MHSKITLRFRTSLTAQVLAAFACCVSATSFAGELMVSQAGKFPTHSKQGTSLLVASRDVNLKLDFALNTPTLAALDDECDDAASHVNLTSQSGLAPNGQAGLLQRQSAPVEMLLAKLEPVDQLVAERLKQTNQDDVVLSAASRRTKKSSSVQSQLPSAPPPVAASKPASSWEIVPHDKTLNTALTRWATQAGWQLVWELPIDYAVEVRTSVPGTFEEAVALVAKSLESAEIPLKAIFYEGNKVLRIVAKGVE